MSIAPFTVSFQDPERSTKVPSILKEYGVAVITDVFTPEACDTYMSGMVEGVQKISPQLSIETYPKLKQTWTDRNIMPQVRKGLHQHGYSFLGWPVRGSEEVSTIFKEVYSDLRGHPVTELVTSLDAINVRPPIPPFAQDTGDWAHVDQTKSADPFACVQGQVVLTNTTAGFRCSPKSHLVHEDILKHFGKSNAPGNFFKYQPHQYQDIQQMVASAGGMWQVPVIAPKGSMILWFSATTHSAKLADPLNLKDYDPDDKWKHWRGVVYCCQRPKSEVDADHLKRLQYAYENNMTTNHWGDKIFKKPRYGVKVDNYAAHITRYTKTPKLIYSIPNTRPTLTAHEQSLIGLSAS
jgi:hypothetical protein